jgi:Tetratricopeptide repeat
LKCVLSLAAASANRDNPGNGLETTPTQSRGRATQMTHSGEFEMRKISIFMAAALGLLVLSSLAFARHPHCWSGGGFYSNTCYSGFNSPWIGCAVGGYGNRDWGGSYSCVPYRNCYSLNFGGCDRAYNTFYYNSNPYVVGVYINPPIFAPAEALYGPVAVRRFFGVAEPTSPDVVTARDAFLVRKLTEPRKVREASPEYRRKADQFIAQGDMLFREQKYPQAVARYKAAGEMAPDSAEAYWRKGHAYAATKRYELAAASFRRALTLDPDIARGGFSLDSLYGETRMAKEAHLESIAGYCLENTDSADAYFVLGIFLHYSGETGRAEKFFVQAAELAKPDAAYLVHFLPDAVPVLAAEVEL